MAFWSSPNINPKLKSRFVVVIAGVIIDSVKSVSKPSFTVETKSYTLINHKFKYPGIPNWDPVTITFVDNDYFTGFNSLSPSGLLSTEQILNKMISNTGYLTPDKQTHKLGVEEKERRISTPSKASNATNSFFAALTETSPGTRGGTVQIKQLDPEGKPRDTWTLHGPIIKSVKFGDLTYDSDDLVEYTLEIEYDYATYTLGDAPIIPEDAADTE
tara:strand:+ start:476 stop:1120 length:645 start_codon:yes stop_codon:yes gene_type:complete